MLCKEVIGKHAVELYSWLIVGLCLCTADDYYSMLLGEGLASWAPPSKHVTLPLCCFNVGPALLTMVQHWTNTCSMYRLCWGPVGMLRGSTGRVNGETRPTFTNLLITSFFPRHVDGSDWLHKTPLQFIVFIGLDTKHWQCTTPRTTRPQANSKRTTWNTSAVVKS